MLNCFRFLGRHAVVALAAALFVALLLPGVASLARPLLTPTVLLMLTVSVMRVDVARVRRPAAPGTLVLTLLWVLVLGPAAVWAAAMALGLPDALTRALVVWAASPPLVSAVAIATILGFDGAAALVLMVAGNALFPFTLPPVVLALLGIQVDVPVLELSFRLLGYVAAAAAVAMAVRRLAGTARLARMGAELDGVMVVLMLVFALAVMDGVQESLIERTGEVLLWITAAFAAAVAMQTAGWLLSCLGDRKLSGTVALVSGNRNLAIVLVAAGDVFGEDIYLFLAVLQFPIYLLPLLLRPLYRRWVGGTDFA
jgi:bile acid:Na+ symporter, BASS family